MRSLLLLLALAAAVVAVFRPSLWGEFVYDDNLLIQLNPALRSLANIPAFFGRAMWDFTDPGYASGIGYWRPLSALALAIGHQLDGGAPFGFRLVSLAVHGLATGAAFALARRLGLAPIAAALAAALFALHPVQVEAVSWPSAVTDPLLALWVFLTLERYAAWRERGSPGLPIAAALGLLAALLTKETAVALLLVLPAYDLLFGHFRAPREPRASRRFAPATTLSVALVLYAGWRMVVFEDWRMGLERTTTELRFGDDAQTAARLMLLRVEILGDSIATLIDPVHQRMFRPIDPQRSWGDAESWIELGLLLLAVGATAVAWRRGPRVVALGAVLVLAPLVPLVVSLESLGQYALADRYLVVSALGLGLVLAGLAERAAPTVLWRVALGALVVAAGLFAHRRVPVWNDNSSLFAEAVEQTPESMHLRWTYGRALLSSFQESTEREPDLELLELAGRQFEAALDIGEAHILDKAHAIASSFDYEQANIGQASYHLLRAPFEGFDDYGTPLELYELILERYPASATGWSGLGQVRFETGDLEGARKAFARALELDPTLPGAQHGLGIVYYTANRPERALEAFERLLAMRSGDADDLLWAARAAIESGRFERAEAWLDQARALDPTEAEVPLLLGMADDLRRDPTAALQHADDALELDPEQALAHNLRGRALLQLGDADEALLAFRRACDFGPDLFEPHYNVASILLGRGAGEAAAAYLDRAYRLCPDPGVRTTMRGELARGSADDRTALLALFEVDLDRGDLDPALVWAERALALAPDDLEALRAVAEAHRVRREPELALPYLRRADELFPSTFGVVRELALCLVEARRFGEARLELERALELLPPAARIPGGASVREALEAQLREALERLPTGPFEDAGSPPPPSDPGRSDG